MEVSDTRSHHCVATIIAHIVMTFDVCYCALCIRTSRFARHHFSMSRLIAQCLALSVTLISETRAACMRVSNVIRTDVTLTVDSNDSAFHL